MLDVHDAIDGRCTMGVPTTRRGDHDKIDNGSFPNRHTHRPDAGRRQYLSYNTAIIGYKHVLRFTNEGYLAAKLGACSGSRLGGGARALPYTVHTALPVQAANSGGGANAH